MTTATPTEHRFQLTMGAPLVANAGWLSFVRIFFSLYLLAFAQTRSAASIATLPDAYFNPPVGPLMVLSSAPSSIFLVLLQVLVTVGLILLLVGYRTALVSYSLPVVLIFLAGIRFSTGKIDHDILIYLLPLFLARAWGSQLAVRSERFAAPRLDILALFLGFFFLSSGVIKAASGWLDWDYSATASWLDFYRTNYGAETALSGFLSGVPAFMLELLDWATVLLECSILPLLLFKRTTALAVLLCLFFNVAVIFLFGIDFAELFPVYLALLPFALHTVKELRTTGVAGLALEFHDRGRGDTRAVCDKRIHLLGILHRSRLPRRLRDVENTVVNFGFRGFAKDRLGGDFRTEHSSAPHSRLDGAVSGCHRARLSGRNLGGLETNLDKGWRRGRPEGYLRRLALLPEHRVLWMAVSGRPGS